METMSLKHSSSLSTVFTCSSEPSNKSVAIFCCATILSSGIWLCSFGLYRKGRCLVLGLAHMSCIL
jgi:hypothetical protein